MDTQLPRFYNFTIFISLLVIIQACGGSKSDAVFSINANVNAISFSNEVLQPSMQSIAINVSFSGDGLLLGFAPDYPPVTWMNYRTEQVNDKSATIVIDLVNANLFPADSYATKLRLSTGNIDKQNLAHLDIDVSLLIWQLSSNQNKIRFSDTLTIDQIASQSFKLSSANNSWTAAPDVDWLSLDISSGSGDASIQVNADVSGFTRAGLYQANIILTETSSGDSKKIPVDLALDNLYLYADNNRIAFSASPAVNVVEKIVNIQSNSHLSLEWQASSQADWLTLSRIDNTQQLLIQADPSKAPQGQISQASIIISSVNDDRVISETIKISLYQSTQAIENLLIDDVTVNNQALLSDPLNPYIYVGVDNTLRIYQQYTGELINSLVVAPQNTKLEQLIMHPQGDMMLAKALETVVNSDETSQTITHRYQIDLAQLIALNELTFSEIQAPTLPSLTVQSEPLRFVRYYGRYFLVTQALEHADKNLNSLFFDNSITALVRAIDSPVMADNLFALSNDSTIKRFNTWVNDFGDNVITTELTHEYRPDSLADEDQITNFIVSSDQANLFLLSTASHWLSFDGNAFSDNGLLQSQDDLTSLRLTQDGDSLPIFLRYDVFGSVVVERYDAQQALLSSIDSGLQLPGQVPDQLVISSDNQQMILTLNNGADTASLAIIHLTE
jgi:hypothetical protein